MKYSDIIQLDKKNYITTLQDVNWFKYADIDEVTAALNETENNLMLVYALEEFVFIDDNFVDAKSYEQFLYTFLKPEIDENLSMYFTHPTIQHKAVKAGLIPTKNEFYQLLDSIKEDDEELDN